MKEIPFREWLKHLFGQYSQGPQKPRQKKVLQELHIPEIPEPSDEDEQEYSCPCCLTKIKKDAPECVICGSEFKTVLEFTVLEFAPQRTIWASGKPEIDESVFEELASYSPSYSLSRERFDEIFSTLSTNILISPSAFLSAALRIHSGLTLEQNLRFVISKIPEDIRDFAEVKQIMNELKRGDYNQYNLDAYSGAGWLPTYDYPVSVEPYLIDLDTRILGYDSFYHDAWVYNLMIDRAFAYSVDSSALCCFNITLSGNDSTTPSQMQRFWSSLQSVKHPMIFEIVGSGKDQQVVFQFLCHSNDKTRIVNRLMTAFPDWSINLTLSH